MTYFILAIVAVACIGLYQTLRQRIAHEQLEQDRRERYLQRYT
jgi:hypothetical protein